MSLVERRKRSVNCYLLILVHRINSQHIVVNTNFLIGVLGLQGDLDR
uniref:Uncharacterized protein n=1 Tax=Rhizophora mucronata TaxID=61149 RepID=A0A2P2N316_RHIMU